MDEVIKSEIGVQAHTGELFHRTSQPSEDLILERNAELRKDNVLGDLSFGRQVASIPFILWEKAKRQGFDLDCKDSAIAEKELMRFLATEDGRKCMVRDDSRLKYFNGHSFLPARMDPVP